MNVECRLSESGGVASKSEYRNQNVKRGLVKVATLDVAQTVTIYEKQVDHSRTFQSLQPLLHLHASRGITGRQQNIDAVPGDYITVQDINGCLRLQGLLWQ